MAGIARRVLCDNVHQLTKRGHILSTLQSANFLFIVLKMQPAFIANKLQKYPNEYIFARIGHYKNILVYSLRWSVI